MRLFKHKTIIKLLIHLLFWIFYIVILFVFDPPFYYEININWYDKIELDLMSLVLGLTYLNEFFLLPFFIKKKYYKSYTVIVFGLIYIATTIYCYDILDSDCAIPTCFSNNIWIICLPLIFFSLIWIFSEFFEKQKELDKLKSDRLELELKFLKSQINPHVLFNNLNTIYALAIKENETIAEMILMLSENLKYVLNQTNDTFVDLKKDIAFIENYLEFQELRTKGVKNIIYTKKIDSYNHYIAPLILIDLIENAFKYAVYKDDELSDIVININILDGNLHFTCENEFDSTLENKKEEKTQIGLKNLRYRLQLIYKDNYELSITNSKQVYKVDLKIKLK